MRIPLLLEMADQPVVCVGAGPVVAGKVVPLMECGAVVTVIAPEVDAGLARAETVVRRVYEAGDLDQTPRPRLVVAGTGVAAIDDQVAAEAASLGIWCLRIDGAGDVAVPSVIRRGAMIVAIATGAPALTRRLRQVLGESLDERWGAASKVLATLRSDPSIRDALAAVPPSERRRRWRDAVEVMLADGALETGGSPRQGTAVAPREGRTDPDTPHGGTAIGSPGRTAAEEILRGRRT